MKKEFPIALILAFDQGMTSCRAAIFAAADAIVASAQKEFTGTIPALTMIPTAPERHAYKHDAERR